MQDSDNGDAKAGGLKINGVLLNAVPPVFWPDIVAALCQQRDHGKLGTGGFKGEGVTVGLLLTPIAF